MGHSTGGAVAAIVAYKLWMNTGGKYQGWSKKIEAGGIVTFGAPRFAVARDSALAGKWRWYASPPDPNFQAKVALIRLKAVGDPVANVPASTAKSTVGAALARQAVSGLHESAVGSVSGVSGFGRVFEETGGPHGDLDLCDSGTSCARTVHLARFCGTGQVCSNNRCESALQGEAEASVTMPVIESTGPLAEWRKTVDTGGFCGTWQ